MEHLSIIEKYHLPDSVKVTVKKSKHGFYAYLDDYSGCMTVAKSIGELIENINDAILTYFDVPHEEAKKFDYMYLPKFIHDHLAAKEGKEEVYKPLRFTPVPTQCIYA